MKKLNLLALLIVTLSVLFTACNTEAPQQPEAAPRISDEGDSHDHVTELTSNEAVRELFKDGVARIEDEHAFQQVGFMIISSEQPALQYRVQVSSSWSDWSAAEITWSEDELHNARILLDAKASALELRGVESADYLMIELFEEVEASLGTLARDLPLEEPSLQSQSGPSWIVSRSEWGARNPGKKCGNNHRPNRVTIHHTDGSSGRINPALVMRGMQAYHIDHNNWCDVGYHFVVSHNGIVFQGRDERRTGAHVKGQNTNNVGIALMGKFETAKVPYPQLGGAARVLGWVGRTYGIALNRSTVRGHGERMATVCPGRNLLAQIPTIIRSANLGGRIYNAHVFNWRYYLDKHPDLRRNNVNTAAKARKHWRDYGILEGRQGSAELNVEAYYNRYADLRRVFTRPSKNYDLIKHYLDYGIREGRDGN